MDKNTMTVIIVVAWLFLLGFIAYLAFKNGGENERTNNHSDSIDS